MHMSISQIGIEMVKETQNWDKIIFPFQISSPVKLDYHVSVKKICSKMAKILINSRKQKNKLPQNNSICPIRKI